MLRKILFSKVCTQKVYRGFSVYAQEMRKIWEEKPDKVDPAWQAFFQKESANSDIGKELIETPENLREDLIKIYFYIRSFNKRGHELADLDPLNMDNMTRLQSGVKKQVSPELDLKFYGFKEEDLEKVYPISEKKIASFLDKKKDWTLREIDETLRKIYCGKVYILKN